MERLFDVASAAVNGGVARSERLLPGRADAASYGALAEQLAIVELLRRGHKVAVPVVDDDGVDLVVDYSVRVQVKNAHRTRVEPVPGYSYGRLSWSTNHHWEKADVFLLHGEDVGESRWWVVPAAALVGLARTVAVYTGGERRPGSAMARVATFEDAWGIFGG